MIGKKLKFVYSFCLFAAMLGCEHKDSASTQDLKNQVRVANTMAANLWCKYGGYYGDERSITLITYLGLGKISTYQIRKKTDPRQSWGYRYVAFKPTRDNFADYEYKVSAQMPVESTNVPGAPKYNLDIRPAVRKSWLETRLAGFFPTEILNSQPATELVLRARAYNKEYTSVFHPCSTAGSGFVEFLSYDESAVNSHLLSTTSGRTLNARDNSNADRLLEVEWPVREFTLSNEYLTNRRFCTVTPGYNSMKVDIYTLLADGLLKVSTVNWSNSNVVVKTSTPATDASGGDVRARWEFKNDTLRLLSRSAQPWDVIGSSNIWVARGYQDSSGRALIFARDKDRVTQIFQDCERFRNPATGGLTFGSYNLTGDKAKDGAESSTALDALYIDLNISWRN